MAVRKQRRTTAVVRGDCTNRTSLPRVDGVARYTRPCTTRRGGGIPECWGETIPEPIDELAEALGAAARGGAATANDSLVPSGQRPCPICGKHMKVEPIEGIDVDVCEQHGIWLDNSELPVIIERARSSSRTAQRAAVARARRQGKISGNLLGVWAFLLD